MLLVSPSFRRFPIPAALKPAICSWSYCRPVICLEFDLFPSCLVVCPSPSTMSTVAAARYGKDNVRVYKVHRDQKTGVQTVVEMTVCVLLEGEIDTS